MPEDLRGLLAIVSACSAAGAELACRKVRGHLENGVVREAGTEGQLPPAPDGVPEDLRGLLAIVADADAATERVLTLAAADAAAQPSAAE